MNETQYWQAVLQRDQRLDGAFVYAVRSTGIYCRPSCPSRRPRRELVRFFSQPDEAEQAGFRACQRCHPRDSAVPEPHLDLVAQVCRYLAEQNNAIPTLDELGRRFAISPYHLQRTFKRIVGVTPRQYADSCRRDRLKAQLKQAEDITEALYGAGYGSSSSLYADAATHLGMTPQSYRRGGEAATIAYTITSCALGQLLVAATERGICSVSLGDDSAGLVTALAAEYPTAVIERDDEALGGWVRQLLEHLAGAQPHLDLPLDVRATAFQRRVWEALQAIPYGSTRSYSEVARSIGQPTAARAVARACATNPVALLIPCHRVLKESGALGGYRWGIARKQTLLEQERRGE